MSIITRIEKRKKMTVTDARIFAPATERNRDHILKVFKDRLPETGHLLEVASGSGEHAAYLAPHFPNLKWQPTNYDDEHIVSTEAWRQHAAANNILPTLRLDAAAGNWPVEDEKYTHGPFDAVFNANMIHISPWIVCEGLFAGAGRVLKPGAHMYLYGPYMINGEHTAPSNAQFDVWLKDKDPGFGVRDLADVCRVAEKNNIQWVESLIMPSNNFIQVFEKG